MRIRPCPREAELTLALKSGHWPEASDPSLRRHVENCSSCAHLVLVSSAFKEARTNVIQDAPLQPPGLLWWRAQLMRRDEALHTLEQPVSLVGKLALVSSVVVLLGCVALQWPLCKQWLRWLGEIPRSESFHLAALLPSSTGWSQLLLITGLAALALIGGFAVYLASEK